MQLVPHANGRRQRQASAAPGAIPGSRLRPDAVVSRASQGTDSRPGVAMKLEVRLFAGARDRAGAATLTAELPDGATVAELRRRLAQACPALNALLPHSVFAVNDEFADD